MALIRKEARFAVGSRSGPRSTIWKVWVQGNEGYLSSRMFGSELKVSLHSTGECQWSCTDSWVKKHGCRNAQRHITRWLVDKPLQNRSVLAFKVDIPSSEIRSQPPLTDKKKVFWISNFPAQSTVRFIFYITSMSDHDPIDGSSLPHRPLFSLKFRDGRWLVILVDLVSIPKNDIDSARSELAKKISANGLALENDLRACVFMNPNQENQPKGLLELCLIAA